MSHDFHVRCLCGECSSEWNIRPEILVGAVKQSAVLKAVRQSGWGEDLWDLRFLGHSVDGLAAFLCQHFDHGGFEVCGEYTNDVPIDCRPDMEYGAYASVCLVRIKDEIAAIEDKLERLKSLATDKRRCEALYGLNERCTLDAGHGGDIHAYGPK